jgi:hypothetical protein
MKRDGTESGNTATQRSRLQKGCLVQCPAANWSPVLHAAIAAATMRNP